MDILNLNLEHSDQECPINFTFDALEDAILQKCSLLTNIEVLDTARHSIIDNCIRHIYDGEDNKIVINISDIILVFHNKVKELLGTSDFSEAKLYTIGLYTGRTVELVSSKLSSTADMTLNIVKIGKLSNLPRERLLDTLRSASGIAYKKLNEEIDK